MKRDDMYWWAMMILVSLAAVLVPVALKAEDVPTCEAVGKAAGHTVYRCVDEQEGNIIYLNELGFMFVVEW